LFLILYYNIIILYSVYTVWKFKIPPGFKQFFPDQRVKYTVPHRGDDLCDL